jgi:hypothetical protein
MSSRTLKDLTPAPESGLDRLEVYSLIARICLAMMLVVTFSILTVS